MAELLKDVIHKINKSQVDTIRFLETEWLYKIGRHKIGEGIPLGTFFRSSPDMTSKINPVLLRNALYSQYYGADQQHIQKRLSVLPERMYIDMEGYGLGWPVTDPETRHKERIAAMRKLMDYADMSMFIYDELAWYGKEALQQYEEREKLRQRLVAYMRKPEPELPKLVYYKGDGKRVPMPHLEVAFADVWSMRRAVYDAILPKNYPRLVSR